MLLTRPAGPEKNAEKHRRKSEKNSERNRANRENNGEKSAAENPHRGVRTAPRPPEDGGAGGQRDRETPVGEASPGIRQFYYTRNA